MNFDALLKAKRARDTFVANHPKFPAFVRAVREHGVPEGTDILISVTYPDGQNMRAGIHVKPEDLELLQLLSSVTAGEQ